jgi:hypothetical protein
MNSPAEADQRDTGRVNQAGRLGRELAELVDEWSVTPSGARAQEIAAEMIVKARELLRASTPLPQTARVAQWAGAGSPSTTTEVHKWFAIKVSTKQPPNL